MSDKLKIDGRMYHSEEAEMLAYDSRNRREVRKLLI